MSVPGRHGRRNADLVTLLALGVVLAMVAVAVFAAAQVRERAWRDAAAEAERVASALRFSVGQVFLVADQALDSVVRQLDAPGLQDLDAAARRAALRTALPHGPAHGGTIVLDADGAIVFLSHGEASGTGLRDDREYFTVHRSSPGRARPISAPLHGRTTGRPLLVLSQRLDHPDGSFRGVAATAIEVGHLQALFEEVRIGPGGSVALVRDNDIPLVRVPFVEGLVGRGFAHSPAFQAKLAAGGRPFTARASMDSEERLFVTRDLDGLPLAVWVNVLAADVRATWLPAAIRIGIIFGGLSVALLAVVLLFRREIARRTAAEAAAGESAALFRLIADHSPDLVVVVGPDRRRRFVSAASERLFGVRPETLLGGDVEASPVPEDRPILAAARARLARGEAEEVTVEYRVAWPDGRIVWVEVALRAVPGSRGPGGVAVVAITRDVTRQKLAEAALARRATTDALTGALNRQAFAEALADATLRRLPVAVVAVDLDHFKEVNDAEGHAAGDAVLCAAADRLRATIRAGDAVARLGGDEFAVLLRDLDDDRASADIAERMCRVLREPVPWRGRPLPAGATLGLARAPGDAPTAEAALRAADEALVRAKRRQRGSIGRADAQDIRQAARAAAILRGFPDPGGPGEVPGLSVVFQPVVRFDGFGSPTGAVIALEALARWMHPDLGPVPPDELLRVLGPDRGALVGRSVRALALTEFAALRRQGLVAGRLALNLSAAEVLRPEVILLIEEQAAEAGLGLDALMLEITEEVLIERVSDRALDLLAGLQRRGALLALDDFGTGSAGMIQLLRLNFGAVKLDRRFVRDMGAEPRAREIVRAAVSLARGMEIELVAEGVETPAQAAALWALGCEALQGYLVARPMPAAAMARWLQARSVAVR